MAAGFAARVRRLGRALVRDATLTPLERSPRLKSATSAWDLYLTRGSPGTGGHGAAARGHAVVCASHAFIALRFAATCLSVYARLSEAVPPGGVNPRVLEAVVAVLDELEDIALVLVEQGRDGSGTNEGEISKDTGE